MPDLFLFANNLPKQTEEKTFGKKSTTQFRITSSYTMTEDSKAYAMLNGYVLLMQQSDPAKVNLILKPTDLSSLEAPVKYIIYRGLEISSFLTDKNILSSTTLVLQQGSEWINKINETRKSNEIIPLSALFGYDLTPGNDLKIDTYFHNRQNQDSQLFPISAGCELGHFTTEEFGGGIEIVLESPDFHLNVETAKKEFYEVNLNGVPASDIKWEKEQIRNFMDPAAFYGIHRKMSIGYVSNDNVKGEAKSSSDIYNNIVAKFQTKDTIYLDIRGEHSYSYNSYGNYSNGKFKIGSTAAGPFTEKEYGDNDNCGGWPLYVINENDRSNNTFYLSLRKDGNNNRVAIGRFAASIKEYGNDKDIKSGKNLFYIQNLSGSGDADYTHPIKIELLYTDSTLFAGIVRIDYIRGPAVNEQSKGVFQQVAKTDFIFGPIDNSIPWSQDSSRFSLWWTNGGTYNYHHEGEKTWIMRPGMVKEVDGTKTNYLYYSSPVGYFNKKRFNQNMETFSDEGGAFSDDNFFYNINRKLNTKIEETNYNTSAAGTLRIYEYAENKEENIFVIAITEQNKNDLENSVAATLADFHYKTLLLQPMQNAPDNNVYAYRLVAAGIKPNGEYDIAGENHNITLYTTDRKIFKSSTYTLSKSVQYKNPNGGIKGYTASDAKKFKEDIEEILINNKFSKFKDLIALQGRKFKHIDPDKISEALNGITLSLDEKTYIEMITNTINSNEIFEIAYFEATPAGEAPDRTNVIPDLLLQKIKENFLTHDPSRIDENGNLAGSFPDGSFYVNTLGMYGGDGFTFMTKKTPFSIILENYSGHNAIFAPREVTSMHELLGHGIPLSKNIHGQPNNANAIQADNVVRRILGLQMRDGSDHGGGRVSNYDDLPMTK